MNWENTIGIVVSSIAISISTYYLKKGNADEIQKNPDGNYVLSLPKMYKYTGILSILIVSVFMAGAILIQDKITVIMAILMFVLFGGLGIPCLLAYQNYRLEFNDKTITVFNWKGEKKEIFWSEIKEIKFSSLSGYIKIYGNQDVLKINHHLQGLDIFKNKINQQTKWNTRELKIP